MVWAAANSRKSGRATPSRGRRCQPSPKGATHRHGRQAGKSGAAQQLQQQRLRLILRMMRGQQAFARPQIPREAQVTRVARRRLDRHAAAGLNRNWNDAERNAQSRAQRGAGLAQGSGRRLQPMIDVHGANRQTAPRCEAHRLGAVSANSAIAANKHAESAPPLTATTNPVAAAGTCSSSTALSNAALKLIGVQPSRNTPNPRKRAWRASSNFVMG